MWEEEEKFEEKSSMIDVAFKIECEILPYDHISELSNALTDLARAGSLMQAMAIMGKVLSVRKTVVIEEMSTGWPSFITLGSIKTATIVKSKIKRKEKS